MRLLVLAHVDGDYVVLTAIQVIRKRQCSFCFSDAGRTAQHEHTNGFVGVVQLGAGCLYPLGNHRQAMPLPYHPLVHGVSQCEQGLDLVTNHLAQGNPRPVLHDRRHGQVVHRGQHQGRLHLKPAQLTLGLSQLGDDLVHVGSVGTNLLPQCQDLADDLFLNLPALPQGTQLLMHFFDLCRELANPFGMPRTHERLALEYRKLGVHDFNAPLPVFNFGRCRMLADGYACTRGIEQTDSLVGQLPCRNISVRQLDGSFYRAGLNLHLMVLLKYRDDATKHLDAPFFIGLAHLNHLEPAGQCRVFLKVFLVLSPGGCGNGTQLAPGQSRLEQVGSISGAGCATCANQGMRLINEQDRGLG